MPLYARPVVCRCFYCQACWDEWDEEDRENEGEGEGEEDEEAGREDGEESGGEESGGKESGGEEAGGEKAGGEEARGEEARGEDRLIGMEQQLVGHGAELPSVSVLLHQLSQVGGVNDGGFELLRLEDLLLLRHCSQPEVATAWIEQYNSLMEELGAETGIEGKLIPSDREGAIQHLRADGNFVPFVMLEVMPALEQQQLVAAFTFEVKLPASPTTTVARLALWDVFTRVAYRRRHLYKDAHCAVALELVRKVRGLMCIELRCRDTPEVIAAHVQAGYYCTPGAGAAQEALPTEQLQLAKAVVQTMREAPGSGVYNRLVPACGSEPTEAEAKVLERIESELGAASGGQHLEIRRAAVRTVLCPPPLLQPVTSEARSGWMGEVGVAEWVIRRADSWPRRAHELLCEYLLASADGPSLLSRGARGVALTYPRASSNETPEWVSTCLRETLGLQRGALIPGDVAVLSAIDVAVAALVGLPPQDLLQGGQGVQQDMLRTHLLDGRCRRGQGGWRRPCVLCETYPLVLAAMEQLVALATSHADCCLPAAVERPACPADPHCIVNVTLRRKGIRAKTPQEPPLWAMCVPARARRGRTHVIIRTPMHPHTHSHTLYIVSAPSIVKRPTLLAGAMRALPRFESLPGISLISCSRRRGRRSCARRCSSGCACAQRRRGHATATPRRPRPSCVRAASALAASATSTRAIRLKLDSRLSLRRWSSSTSGRGWKWTLSRWIGPSYRLISMELKSAPPISSINSRPGWAETWYSEVLWPWPPREEMCGTELR